MIDLTKIPKAAVEWIGGLLGREAAGGRFIDDLPPIPPDVRDAFLWRLAQGHIQPDVPAKRRSPIELMTRDSFEIRFRED